MTTFKIGNLDITRVEDFVDYGVPLSLVFPAVTNEAITANRAWLAPNFLNPENNTINVHISTSVKSSSRVRPSRGEQPAILDRGLTPSRPS
jgi:hypothetical protein